MSSRIPNIQDYRLKSLKQKKFIKFRNFDKYLLDCDYIPDLSEEDEALLMQFFDEWINASFQKSRDTSLLFNDEQIQNQYIQIKNNKDEYSKFRKDLKKENEKRKNKWIKMKDKHYQDYIGSISNNKDRAHLLMNYKRLGKKPNSLKQLNSLEFIIVRIKRKLSSAIHHRRNAIVNRDCFKIRSLNIDDLYDITEKDDVRRKIKETEKRFLHCYNNKKIDQFLYEEIIFLIYVLNTTPEQKNKEVLKVLNDDLNEVYKLYNNKKINKNNLFFYMLTTMKTLEINKNFKIIGEGKKIMNYILNIFDNLIYIRSKKKNKTSIDKNV